MGLVGSALLCGFRLDSLYLMPELNEHSVLPL
jgi:hypothetical protein